MRYTRERKQNIRAGGGCLKSKKSVRQILTGFFMLFFSAAIICGAILLSPPGNKNETASALEGLGTKEKPFTISTVADLQTFASNVNAGTTYLDQYIELEADLDLSGLTWTPIGNATTKRFYGHFNGNGHTISNMYISQTAAGKGLFGWTTGATIEDLILYNPTIASAKGNYVGALVGYFETTAAYPTGSITECHVFGGTIQSTGLYVGAMVGYAKASADHGITVENCTVKGTGTNKVPTEVLGYQYVGGLIGTTNGSAFAANADGSESAGVFVTLCASTAHVTATLAQAGGIIGWAGGTRIDQCYSTGAIACKNAGYAGGIVGLMGQSTPTGASSATTLKASKITNCLATGDLNVASDSSHNAYAGGIVAGITGIAGCYVQDCLFTGNALTRTSYSSGIGAAGGIVGIVNVKTAYIGGCVVASQRISGLGGGGSYYLSSPFANAWYSTSWVYPTMIPGTTNYYNEDVILSSRRGGYATATNSIHGNAVSLDTLKEESTYTSLGWDFSSGTGIWHILGGTNDGFPYLKGLGIPEQPLGSKYNPILINTAEDFKAMSTHVNAATNSYASQYLLQTADLDLTGIGITGTAYAKPFRGNYDGGEHRLLNVNITSTAAYTGIFGYVVNASFRNVIVENPKIYNTGSVSNVGILVGVSAAALYMENCAVIGGTLTAVKATNVGALCGYCNYDNNNFVKCFSSATISGGSITGGLIGFGVGANLSQCYTKGTITASLSSGRTAGGLVGELYRPLHTVTSVYAYDESITTNVNTNCATPTTTVTDCYSMCNITDTHSGTWAFAGGIIGRAAAYSTSITSGNIIVQNCYFNGSLSAVRSGSSSTSSYGAFAGGIIGASYVMPNIYVNNCLSVMQLGTMSSTGKWLQAGYFNTYYNTAPQISENCYFVATEFPDLKGGEMVINTGTETTLEAIQAGTVFSASALGWDMDNVWSQDATVNGGFPILRGLIVDTSDLVDILELAKKYKEADWSTLTYTALARVISSAEKDLSGSITEQQKAKDIAAIQAAIDGLRADKEKLSSLHNQVIQQISPNKDYYTNFSVVESLLIGAENILDDDTNKYRNSDVDVVYSALEVAINNLRIDKTDLNTAIEEANALKASDYPQEAFKVLQEELTKAVAVNNNADATVTEVIEATKNLQAALSALKLDKTQIANAIIVAYKSIGVVAEYDQESNVITLTDETDKVSDEKFENYTAFGTALTNALNVQADKDATSEEIQDAIFDLNVALYALSLDKKPLQELYYKALSLNKDYYSQESFAKLTEALSKAETALNLYASPSTLVEISKTLDEAYDTLKVALDGLEFDKAELEKLINQAKTEEEDSDLYTEDTWNKLQEVLAGAEEVYEKDEATQEEIHKAIVDLNEAIQNLDLNRAYLEGLVAQATKILDDETYQDFYLPDTLQKLETARDNAQSLIEANCQDISTVKDAAHELQSALDELQADTEKLEGYIDRVLNEENEDYIDPKVYASEGVNALKELAEEAQKALVENTYTNEDVFAYILRFEALFNELKPNKEALIELAKEVSTWTNTKYRQNNEGKWEVDENGNLKVYVIYEVNSWNVLQSALSQANTVILDKEAKAQDVKEAYDALENAIDGLIVDTSELEERIKKAESLLTKQEQEEVYTSDTIEILKTKYDAAVQLLADTTVKLKLDDVQACLDELLAAINGLKVDKQHLLDLIKKAEDLSKYEDYFTESSFSALNTQLSYVKDNVTNDSLDESDISFLYGLLSDAIDALEIVTDSLDELIDRFDKLEEEFVADDAYGLLDEVAGEVKAMLEKGEFTVEDYINELAKLTSAFDYLAPDMEAFKAFIDKCKEYLELSYTDESKAALSEQIESAEILYTKGVMNEEGGYDAATYDEVIASVNDLRDAVHGLVPMKTALQELIESTQATMNGIVEEIGEETKVSDCYTAESYKILTDALDNGLIVLEDSEETLEDVDNAISEIKAAIESLVVDNSRLQALIDECDELYKEDYFEPESYAIFKEKLDQSKADVEEELTLEDFISSYSNLLQARDGLVFSTAALDELIALAEEKEEEDYSAASFEALSEELKTAKDYRDEEEKDSDAYNDVCSNLLGAIRNLVYIGDLLKEISAVQEFVDKGNNIENGVYYSVGSFKAVEDLLAEANSLKNELDPAQAEVDYMVALLKDYESLLLDVTDAKKFSDGEHEFIEANEGKYTEETWSVYADKVDALDELLANDEVTLEKLDEAMKAVSAAKEALQSDSEDDANNGLLEVIATNNTFKFIYGDGTELDFKTHLYDESNPVYLTNIALGDRVSDIIAQFVNEDIKAYDASGAEITDLTKVIATGMVLKVFSGETVVDSVTLVVKGDINGDGTISGLDKAQLNAYTNGTRTLTGAFFLACDINGDGTVSGLDKAQLNAYTNGTRDIYAGLSVKEGA